MAKASIEPIAGCMRIWLDETKGYGDPYDAAVTVRWIDKETIEVIGLASDKFGIPVARAIRAEAKRWHATRLLFVRKKNGIDKQVWVKV